MPQFLIIVEIDDDGGIIIADTLFDNFGTGDTLKEAFDSYLEDLSVYCEVLAEGTDEPANANMLAYIKKFVPRIG